ncbi:hypothetical protein HO173_008973 [Letharia columbiana]|uniref:Uncharacterized protein n=1 Tax=Letharia columbiana TaxID=112416 RepID=A0A8H6FQD5_9LECA|nr:uncharacterized protein HO173_008973 [Letharia columbiana]KAF6232759.1 hypothetical protein HO173_008973 [Letharia columbiana]
MHLSPILPLLLITTAAPATAQVIFNTSTYQFICPSTPPNAAYCAGPSLTSNIIIRCTGTSGQAGNCNDNLAGVPPLGVKGFAPCDESSPTAGDAACSYGGTVYPDGVGPGFPVPGPGSNNNTALTTTAASNVNVSLSITSPHTSLSTSASTSTSYIAPSIPPAASTALASARYPIPIPIPISLLAANGTGTGTVAAASGTGTGTAPRNTTHGSSVPGFTGAAAEGRRTKAHLGAMVAAAVGMLVLD